MRRFSILAIALLLSAHFAAAGRIDAMIRELGS
jgi:hypothetical protein